MDNLMKTFKIIRCFRLHRKGIHYLTILCNILSLSRHANHRTFLSQRFSQFDFIINTLFNGSIYVKLRITFEKSGVKMKNRYFKRNLKNRIIAISLLSTLALGSLIAGLSYFLFQKYLRNSLIQSTEINLQFTADSIESNMDNIYSFAKMLQNNSNIKLFAMNGASDVRARNRAYTNMNEQYMNNSSRNYMLRIAVVNNLDQMIQIVPSYYSTVSDIPSIAKELPYFDVSKESYGTNFSMGILKDPFRDIYPKTMLPIVLPIQHIYNSSETGYIFLQVDTALFTEAAAKHNLSSDSEMHLTISDHTYSLSGNGIEKLDSIPDSSKMEVIKDRLLYGDTKAVRTKNASGNETIYVTRPLAFKGWYLTQSISRKEMFGQRQIFYSIIILLLFFLIAVSLILPVYLNRLVNVPVKGILSRLEKVSSGNFNQDKSIEWDNEFGDIGRGINSLSTRVSGLMEKRISDQKQQQEYEYKLLQSQINPHFIYNTLNSIKWMANAQGAGGISEMVTALSRLLKNIAKSGSTTTTISSELDLIKDYITIQKYRYGGTVRWNFHIGSEELLKGEIVRFTLQPIVENAIFHGIEPKGTTGTIDIHLIENDEGQIQIDILDDGIGMTDEMIEHLLHDPSMGDSSLFKSYGMYNVQKRLQYEFGPSYGLKIMSEVGQYTKVSVILPNPSAPDNKENTDD